MFFSSMPFPYEKYIIIKKTYFEALKLHKRFKQLKIVIIIVVLLAVALSLFWWNGLVVADFSRFVKFGFVLARGFDFVCIQCGDNGAALHWFMEKYIWRWSVIGWV